MRMTNKEAIKELEELKESTCEVLVRPIEALTLAIKAIEFQEKAKIAYYHSDCYLDFINYFSVILKEADNDSRTDFDRNIQK